MGGRGSGRPSSWPTTLGDLYKLELRFLHRQGCLKPGYSGSLRWSRNGRQTGSIGFAVHADCLILNFRTRARGGEWKAVEQIVPLVTTQQNFGGTRSWMLCPDCQRRCAVLYGNARYRCRQCTGLSYATQHENEPDRLLRRAQDLRERVGGPDYVSTIEPFPPRPKGMHQHTYDRLRNKCEQIENDMWQAAAEQFGLVNGLR